MNVNFSEFLDAVQSRTVTLHAADGHPMVQAKVLHAAAITAVGVALAPRLVAAAAVGALFKGLSLSVETTEDGPAPI